MYRDFSLWLIFWIAVFTICSPDKNWSKMTPRYFTHELDSMVCPLHLMFKQSLGRLPNFLLRPNITLSVFPRWRESWLSTSQSWQDYKATDNLFDISFGSLCEKILALSSAYNSNFHSESILICMSFTYVKKIKVAPINYPVVHHMSHLQCQSLIY